MTVLFFANSLLAMIYVTIAIATKNAITPYFERNIMLKDQVKFNWSVFICSLFWPATWITMYPIMLVEWFEMYYGYSR